MSPIKIALSAVTLLALAACNLPGTPAQPTATSIMLPVATQTAAPALPTDEPAAPTPSGEVALEAILIGSPGLASAIRSPMTVSGQSRPTFEQTLLVAIYSADGELIAQQPTTIAAEAGSPGPFSAELHFSVSEEQPGRVAVMETSALDGGIVHLASVEVTLLPGGEARLLAQPVASENIDIQSPAPNTSIAGGNLTVSGFSAYYFESNLGLLLCGAGAGPSVEASTLAHSICGDASVLASSFASIAAPDIGQPGPFSGTLSWSVSQAVPGRIVLYAGSMRDGGLLHLSSIPVLIQP